jgi:hypothetical protein
MLNLFAGKGAIEPVTKPIGVSHFILEPTRLHYNVA